MKNNAERWFPGAHILLTVLCEECADERVRPEQLGQLFREQSGAVGWVTFNRRLLRTGDERGAGAWEMLSDPRVSWAVPPDMLTAFCSRHGEGCVSTADVLTQRGTVVLKMVARA